MPKATLITRARHAPAEMKRLGSGEVPSRGPPPRAVMAVRGGQLSEEYNLGLHLSPSAFFLFDLGQDIAASLAELPNELKNTWKTQGTMLSCQGSPAGPETGNPPGEGGNPQL